jgi:hypothetical protein
MAAIAWGNGARYSAAVDLETEAPDAMQILACRIKTRGSTHEHRRVAAFILRHVCRWDLPQIAIALRTSKGRVLRMVRRANEKIPELMADYSTEMRRAVSSRPLDHDDTADDEREE